MLLYVYNYSIGKGKRKVKGIQSKRGRFTDTEFLFTTDYGGVIIEREDMPSSLHRCAYIHCIPMRKIPMGGSYG